MNLKTKLVTAAIGLTGLAAIVAGCGGREAISLPAPTPTTVVEPFATPTPSPSLTPEPVVQPAEDSAQYPIIPPVVGIEYGKLVAYPRSPVDVLRHNISERGPQTYSEKLQFLYDKTPLLNARDVVFLNELNEADDDRLRVVETRRSKWLRTIDSFIASNPEIPYTQHKSYGELGGSYTFFNPTPGGYIQSISVDTVFGYVAARNNVDGEEFKTLEEIGRTYRLSDLEQSGVKLEDAKRKGITIAE